MRQTSVGLLDSLESFLSTFQRDLSAVSGQISDLQSRSRDIEGRLKSRRVCLCPLFYPPCACQILIRAGSTVEN
jgi:hypothetical protein